MITLSHPSSNTLTFLQHQQLYHPFNGGIKSNLHFFHSSKTLTSLRASRRISDFPQESSNLVDDPRNWKRTIRNIYDDNDEDGDNDDDDDEDRSLDLLIRFIENVFKKISRKARKAVRLVLPVSISTKLVGFSVNGVLMLALLWVLKAFLEVVCTLGSVVFVSILLIRGIWSGITYLQETRNRNGDVLDDEPQMWAGAQPAA